MDTDIEDAAILGALDHAVREGSLEKLGEDRQHVESHGRFKSFNPSGNSTAMRFSAGLISTQMERANGISRSSPMASRPEPPPSSHPVTRPRLSPVRRSITSHPIRSD